MSYVSNYDEFIGVLIWFLGGLDNLLLSLMIFVAVVFYRKSVRN